MNFLVKTIISSIIIAAVTLIAKQYPKYGGIIAALPLVSLLSLFWLYLQGEPTKHLGNFLFGVLYGLPGTIILILIVALSLKYSLPFLMSLLLGISGWLVFLKLQGMIVEKIYKYF
ncbi:DUF3147 family protein [Peribacillus cavernae]|uniref:DUF3147 family protein n=1 Tax=Peribacillus cavernae TaxID=1674310 RepID=A0A3S1B1R9_9BACI|nr:DUF3147 family protein [Peribacillus cavernae]MDQ0219720.1 putative neutral ceramidase superfamily lipid hydrolase [Peribacillus cavernae]RUQ25995.1 DUF3147 family protein [Peribacillus cavernae]